MTDADQRSTMGIARLWLPTAASTSMLTLEIPLLLAIAARVGDDEVAVAGLGLALGIVVPVNAAALALATTSAVAVQRAWPRRTVRSYALLVGAAGCTILAMISSGLIDGAIQSALGVDAATWQAARDTLRGLALAPLLVAVRRYTQGYLIAAGDTAWFLPATLTRMVTSVLLAALLTQVFARGTFAIGLALLLGVALEAGVLSFRSRAARAADTTAANRRGLLDIARVHAPLAGSMLLTVLPPTVVLLALSATAGSAEILAAWPVLYGLAWLVAGTTLDLEAITAANLRASAAATLRFTVVLGAGITLLWAALEFDPLADAYFREFSGLGGTTAELAMTGVVWLVPFPFLCAAREWLRGALVARDRSPSTVVGVAAGFVVLVLSYVIGYAAGLTPIIAAAVSVTVGGAAEVAALMVLAQPLPTATVRQAAA